MAEGPLVRILHSQTSTSVPVEEAGLDDYQVLIRFRLPKVLPYSDIARRYLGKLG